MTQPKHNEQRRRHYIDRRVQGQLIRRILVHWAFFFLTLLVGAIGLQLLLGDPDIPVSNRLWPVAAQFTWLGLLLLALLPAFLLDTIKFSNRFVGPMFRLRRGLTDLADGQSFGPMSFRERDFWKEVAEQFNRVQARIQAQDNELAELRAHAAKNTSRVRDAAHVG
jgi:hypothetical protein